MTRLVPMLVALGALAARPLQSQATAAPARLPGIVYTVDTAGGRGPIAGLVNPVRLRVTYAAGRGRVDVPARPDRPAIRAKDVVLARSLAGPGDYYLFDSTGFVLVRPAVREFSSFRLADVSFNYEGRRDGWPPGFRLDRFRPDTLGAEAPRALLTRHGPFPIYWHVDAMDVDRGEVARGRVAVADAPPAEMSVARWFGPTQALATLPGGVARLAGRPITLVAVSLWQATDGSDGLTNITALHPLLDLREVEVEAASLVLPPGFRETHWPGYEGRAGLPPPSADGGAKWRVLRR